VAGEPIAASAAGGADADVPACALPMPAGMRRSTSGMSRRRLSGRSSAVRSVSVAIMPQPMSTPIAYGMIAPCVGDDRADRRAEPGVRVRHEGHVRRDAGQGRRGRSLVEGLVLDVAAPGEHLRSRVGRHAWSSVVVEVQDR
jgi:hypothetical protein